MARSPGRGSRSKQPQGVEPTREEVRMLVRVARMYHEQQHKQADIARELHISTARVSRLLARAIETGIVTTVVRAPEGANIELEDAVRERYCINEVITAEPDVAGSPQALITAAARHLEATLAGERCLGIATWSSTLQAVVDELRATPGVAVGRVAQLVGGFGSPRAQAATSRMMMRLATQFDAEVGVIPAPGLLGSSAARDGLMGDPPVQQALQIARRSTVALVGIGTMEPSWLIRESGNALPESFLATLAEQGAVGDVCLRLFDAEGRSVESELDRRVVGITSEELRRIPRRIAVAGGIEKTAAIAGALRGGLVSTLITDTEVAERLLDLN